ncbi:D-inositol-3-phosphate glycosyltransferase [Allobranchiibius sp. GilTou38]|uniref:D-inositol-3-phosphate glycosyltransferase n=1 Tax=Allobranchiibius sp. GilTou38 TaxID=2815210 RepID=UPI001AA0DE00|nr:D-inositol-3-phosphate glycosyltransferase [Allobranchiibius sp. GilTou38]MBO1767015.1 D-inositol-3-phosphate glycosyltransferase [Allobranchiibius sp. GilTou38]
MPPLPEIPSAVRRVAMISVHTSPLEQPGTGDAGGMNVYVLETARRLGERSVEVEIFTRRTSAASAEVVPVAPGVLVRHIDAGPYEGLSKDDLPGQLCAFAAGVMRLVAISPEGHYDLVHSHYWLSGQVGWLAADRWNVPLVHTMHTMAKVKNRSLAQGDRPEPAGREIGEEQVVRAASLLVANTEIEARELVELYDADPARVRVVPPGVDLVTFAPGDQQAAREALELPQDAELVLFVGRIQALKGPDVLLRAAAEMVRRDPERRRRLIVAVIGGPSGSGLEKPRALQALARELGIADIVQFVPPVPRQELARWFRASDAVAVPSRSESFGLVALEAQACGATVVAADVGGLPRAVGSAGVLVQGHDPAVWAERLLAVLDSTPDERKALAHKAVEHAQRYGWERTTDELMAVYERACRDARTDVADDAGSARLLELPLAEAVIP